jgi:hypothetical protein
MSVNFYRIVWHYDPEDRAPKLKTFMEYLINTFLKEFSVGFFDYFKERESVKAQRELAGR